MAELEHVGTIAIRVLNRIDSLFEEAKSQRDQTVYHRYRDIVSGHQVQVRELEAGDISDSASGCDSCSNGLIEIERDGLRIWVRCKCPAADRWVDDRGQAIGASFLEVFRFLPPSLPERMGRP